MSTLDSILLAILAASALMGMLRGFIGVAASFAAWLLGGWAALALGAPVASMIAAPGPPGKLQLLVGYAVCFVAVSLLIGAVSWLVRRLVHGIGLGPVDRGLGLMAGLVRGAFVASLVVMMLSFAGAQRAPQFQRSALVPIFMPGARWLAARLPDWAVRRLDLRRHAQPAEAPLPA